MDEDELRRRFGARAEVFATDRFFCAVTCSGRFWSVVDVDAEIVLQRSDAPEQDLGAAVRRALVGSRFHSREEAARLMSEQGQTAWEALEERWRVWSGTHSRRQLYRWMLRCAVQEDGRSILITPTVHERAQLWSYLEGETVVVGCAADDVVLGDALRMALARCIP